MELKKMVGKKIIIIIAKKIRIIIKKIEIIKRVKKII